MKKTLLITYFFPPNVGGIENYYLNLLEHLDKKNLVVLAQNHPDAETFDKTRDYSIYRAEFFAGKISPTWKELRHDITSIIKHEKIEQIVFGHFHPFNILGTRFNLPYYIFGHGTDIIQISFSWWQKMIFRKSYKNCQKIIANSKYIAGEIEKIVKDRKKINIVYPGINFDELTKPLSKVEMDNKKQLLDIKDDDIVMLSIGRLEPEKNYDTIIRSIPSLLDKISNLKYIIVGDGSEMSKLKNLVGQFDLKNQVKFVGQIENLDKEKRFYCQLAHLFITVSTKPEGFGIGYLEAQACTTPVVASKYGGSSEAVLNNQTGILVDPKNQDEIISAVYKILTDKKLWQLMADKGKNRAQEQFDWQIQAEKIKTVLK